MNMCFIVLQTKKKKKKKKNSLNRIEEDLAHARAAILEAVRSRNYTSQQKEDFIPRGAVYRNPYAFHQLSLIYYENRIYYITGFYVFIELIYVFILPN